MIGFYMCRISVGNRITVRTTSDQECEMRYNRDRIKCPINVNECKVEIKS